MTRFFIKKPVFSFVIMMVAILIGVVSVINTPKQLMPDIDAPVVSVSSTYPGASSEEVLQKVTKPLEEELNNTPGLDSIQSTTTESNSSVTLLFDMEVDVDDVENDILSKINNTETPEDVETNMFKFNTSDFPVVQVALTADELNDDALQSMEEIKNDISKIDGVSSVDISKTKDKFIDINLNKNELEKTGLNTTEVAEVISSNNFSIPGSELFDEEEERETTARFESELEKTKEIEELVIGYDPEKDSDITVGDISQIESLYETHNIINRLDGGDAVLLDVKQKDNANTSEVANLVMEELEKLTTDEFDNIEYHSLFDQGEFTDEAISNISSNVIIGGFLAMVVLLLFLRNVTPSIIVSVSIPFSLMVTFIFFYYYGLSLNIMTLGGLALAVGMLVDNSIVVIENIYRHIQEGEERKNASYKGAKEVAAPIIASTLTTIAVFLPLTFSSGIVKILFSDFALSVSVSLISSLIVSLTVVPTLSSLLMKTGSKNNNKKMSFFGKLAKAALGKRKTTLLIVIVLFVGGLLGIFKTGMELIPDTDEGFVTVSFEEEEDKDFPEKDTIIDNIELAEEYFNDKDEVDNVFVDYDVEKPEEALMSVAMIEVNNRDKSTNDYIEEYDDELNKEMKDMNIQLSTEDTAGTGSSGTLTFSVENRSDEKLKEDVEEITKEVEGLEETSTLETNIKDEKDEFVFSFNKEELEKNGLTAVQVANEVNEASNQKLATTIQTENSRIIDIFVQMNPDDLDTIDKLKEYKIKTESETNDYVKLGEVSEVDTKATKPTIIRSDGAEKVDFTTEYKSSVELSEYTKLVNDAIEDLELDENTNVNFTGDSEMLEDSIKDLLVMLFLSLVLVYLVISAQFGSFIKPIVILISIPLITIGVSVGLTVTETPMSIIALLGIILLVGIVVNNSIVLVDYVIQLKDRGRNTREALLEAVEVRTRPILMTALTTILGLLPIALGIGEGAELQQPMGIVVIGGLISSTFLTLVVIPVFYSYLDKDTRNMNKQISTEDYYVIKKSELSAENKEKLNDLLNKK